MNTISQCQICSTEGAQFVQCAPSRLSQDCPRCGTYEITRTAAAVLEYETDIEPKSKISSWVREQNNGGSTPLITSNNLDSIKAKPTPYVADRAFGLLKEAEKGLTGLGQSFNVFEPRYLAASYSQNKEDIDFLVHMLSDQGLAEFHSTGGQCKILPRGYLKLDEVRRAPSISSQGFVAMWFDKALEEVYSEGFQVGIFEAGYNPIRIDSVEHINKIDDEIIRQINASKFLVADFTGHRGGVYFEAGYAMGIGLPVFWSCHKDHLSKLHFDIRQFNCIDWETSAELAKRLSTRIEAVLGPGPNKKA